MAEKQYRLKTTKTQMYNLAKAYCDITVERKKTEFHKCYRARDYVLEFWQDGELHHFLLAICAGTPMLLHRVTSGDDAGDRHVKSVTHTLRLLDLRVMGMAEEVPQK